MNPLELISGVLLIISSIIIIAVVMLQESNTSLGGAISGSSSNSFYSGNKGRTRQGMLVRLTKISAIIFFVVTLIVNGLNVWLSK